MPPIIPEEAFEGMAGSYEQYRPGCWRVRLYFQGRRLDIYRDEAGKPLRAEFYAQKLLFYLNGLITQKKFIPDQWRKSSPFSMDSALDTWLENSTASEDTRVTYQCAVNKWIKPYWGKFDIREIQSIHVQNFNAHLMKQSSCTNRRRQDSGDQEAPEGKKISDKTRKNIVDTLFICLNYFYEIIPKIPKKPTISFQTPGIRWLRFEEQEKIFQHIAIEDRPIFDFMRYTGCRPNEACGLQRASIYLSDGYLILDKTSGDKSGILKNNTKTKIAKPLPIIPEISETLKPKHLGSYVFMKKHGRDLIPYNRTILGRIWTKACDKTEIRIRMYHGLKHSFACQRLNAGYSLKAIQDILGHTSAKTTERYAKYALDSLAEVMTGKVIQIKKEIFNVDLLCSK
jgi:integrase